MDMFRSVVAPVVKENPVFTDFLLTVLYPVCCTQFCCDPVLNSVVTQFLFVHGWKKRKSGLQIQGIMNCWELSVV